MVSADVELADPPNAVNNFIRAGAIAHQIPEIDGNIVGRSGLKAGLKRLKVGVDVANYEYTHSGEPRDDYTRPAAPRGVLVFRQLADLGLRMDKLHNYRGGSAEL